MLEPLCQLWLYYVRGAPKLDISLTLKRLGEEKGVNLTPPVVFPKMFVTFNIIISHVFPENFIEIPLVVKKIWRFFPSILTTFIDFSDLLTFPCYKETNDVSV